MIHCKSLASSSYLFFILLLGEKGTQTGGFGFLLPGDPGGLTGSRCSSYETQSCLEREALRILAKLCAGGWTSWKGPEPFRKGIQDYRAPEREEIIKKSRTEKREWGKERGSHEKMIQPTNKLLNEYKQGSQTSTLTRLYISTVKLFNPKDKEKGHTFKLCSCSLFKNSTN